MIDCSGVPGWDSGVADGNPMGCVGGVLGVLGRRRRTSDCVDSRSGRCVGFVAVRRLAVAASA